MTAPRSGGRRRGMVYEMPQPRMLSDGNWPHQTFERQTDPMTRQMCERWSDLVFEIRKPDVAKKAGIALNTYEAIARGDAWGTVPTLLKIVYTLELQLEQTTEVRRGGGPSASGAAPRGGTVRGPRQTGTR